MSSGAAISAQGRKRRYIREIATIRQGRHLALSSLLFSFLAWGGGSAGGMATHILQVWSWKLDRDGPSDVGKRVLFTHQHSLLKQFTERDADPKQARIKFSIL